MNSQEVYTAAIEAYPLPIVISDLEGKIIECNNTTFEFLGYESKKDIIGRNSLDFIAPEQRKKAVECLKKTLETGFLTNIKYHLLKADGARIPVELSSKLIKDLGDKPIAFVATIKDISSRIKKEHEIKSKKMHYQRIFENSPISIWQEDFSEVKKYLDNLKKQGVSDIRKYFSENPNTLKECIELAKIIDVNHTTLKLFEAKSKKHFIGSLSRFLTPKSRDTLINELAAIAEGKKLFETEMLTKTMKGKDKMIKITFVVPTGYEKNLSKILFFVVDMTKEESLEEELNLYEKLVKFSGDGVYSYTFDEGVITHCNKGFRDILELECEPKDVIGKKLSDIMIYLQEPGTVRKAANGNGEIHNFAYNFKTLDGREKWVIHDSFIGFDPVSGKKIVEAIVKDITERKNSEIEIKKRLNELEVFNEAAVDREIQIVELKKEVNSLLEKNDKPKKYEVVE